MCEGSSGGGEHNRADQKIEVGHDEPKKSQTLPARQEVMAVFQRKLYKGGRRARRIGPYAVP